MTDHPSYHQESAPKNGVFKLADPDLSPPEGPTRIGYYLDDEGVHEFVFDKETKSFRDLNDNGRLKIEAAE
jgi:hypothetical protein